MLRYLLLLSKPSNRQSIKSLALRVIALMLLPVSSAYSPSAYSAWWSLDSDSKDRGYQAILPDNTAPALISYQYECGACHIAYPPQVLPKASWQSLLSNLDNHFGEDARLDKAQPQELQDYLALYASDSNNAGKFSDFTKRLQNPAPIRITQLNFWRLKHDKVLKKKQQFIINNPDVGSASRCNACHEKAEQGLFQKHTVQIPNIDKREYK